MLAMGQDQYDARLEELGTNLDDLVNVPSATRKLIEFYRNTIAMDALAGAVAFAYYEGRIPRDYPALVQGVENLFGFEEAGQNSVTRTTAVDEIPARWHLDSHAEHDLDHEEGVINGIIAAVKSPKDLQIVRTTLKDSQRAWDEYWDEVGMQVVAKKFTAKGPPQHSEDVEPDIPIPDRDDTEEERQPTTLDGAFIGRHSINTTGLDSSDPDAGPVSEGGKVSRRGPPLDEQ